MDQGIPVHSEHQILKGIFGGKGKIRQPKIIMNFSPEPLLEGWNSLTGNAGIDPWEQIVWPHTKKCNCVFKQQWMAEQGLIASQVL